MDSNSGFWLIHSIPQFPNPPVGRNTYSYPRSGRDNGQNAICVSIKEREVSKIITQLYYMRVNVYSQFFKSQFVSSIPQLGNLLQRKWVQNPTENIATINSVNGEQFKSFARSPRSQYKDLYLELIAPELKTDLLVETWRRGAGNPLNSNCSYQFKVNNIESVKLNFKTQSGLGQTIPWAYSEDHSKWAVGVSKATTCVGDINRMASQAKRGGGSLCINDANVWQTASKSIYEVESCSRNNFTPSIRTTTKRRSTTTRRSRSV